MSRKLSGAVLLALLVASAVAVADESTTVLTQGAGVERVQAYCSMCHSLDYIVMNSPFQDRAGWDKTVTKMVKVMGAPLTPEDTGVIVEYLATNYGKAPTPAAP